MRKYQKPEQLFKKGCNQFPMNTRELYEQLCQIASRMEDRCVRINGAWQLQIRGKDLRRLLKNYPNIKNYGRTLYIGA